jgi:ELWxxDGT repeat protein
VGGTLFFAADDGTRGRELRKNDGTPAGTTLVADIRPGAAGSDPTARYGRAAAGR